MTVHAVRYLRERWVTPDGKTIIAPLPEGTRGHFGPDLIGRIRTATGGASETAFFTLAGVALLGALIILFLRGTQHKTAPSRPAP